ncbi:hypothetical protein PLANPX_3984 [Lacipirellula parvula]|uniref:Uncharacterized protein n=1 Tax=Lacipirellula parvula TaxID=2650471 RepID=A0A5K7XED0_9BACT|nr:hypothetical protein PLANPX_3984 [Lacipirellula parvula]
MPIQVTCPSCQTTLKTADSSAGKRAKCPKCDGVLDIPFPVAEIVEDDEYELEVVAPAASNELGDAEPASEADRRPCPACGEMIARKAIKCRFCNEIFDRSLRGIASGPADIHDPDWLKVRSGVAAIYYSYISIVVAIVLGLVIGGVVTAVAGRDGDAANIAGGIGGLLFVLVFVGAAIGIIVGQVRCTNAPQDSGARGLANGAAICMVLNIVLSMAGRGAQLPALNLLGSLLSAVGWILFILFIRQSASYLGNDDLARSAVRFLIFGVVCFFSAIGAVAVVVAQIEILSIVLGVTLLVMAIMAFIWLLRLLKGLMTTIDQCMSGY